MSSGKEIFMNALERTFESSALNPFPTTGAAASTSAQTPSAARRPMLVPPRFSLGQLYVAWESLKQQGGIYLIYGEPYVLELAQKMLSRPLLARTPVVVVDGNNRFNLYLYTRMAQYFARRPEEFLRRIKISRAFTCHQMVSLVERVEKAAERYQTPLVLALDPLATFYDENVPVFETNKLFKKMERTLRDLARHGFKVLLACSDPAPKQRPQYLEALKNTAIFRLGCRRANANELTLQLERPEEFRQTWTLSSSAVTPISYSRQLSLFQ